MTQDRPTEFIVKSGNYFRDAVENLVEILNREQKEDPDQKLTYINRLIKVYDTDVILIPETPVIAVAYAGHDEEHTTIGQRQVTTRLDIKLDVFYYHQEANLELKQEEIRDALWELCRILRRNGNLNGLSSLGA